jgi:hypothetical protein
MHLHHSPPTTPELLDVLALFPKCTQCGGALSVAEPIEPDPGHAFRLKHCGCCPSSPSVA